jgi:hypothetical protein
LRIKITGNNLAAQTLSGYIHRLGYATVNHLPTFSIELEEKGSEFILDGVDSELERRLLYHLEDLGIGKFIIQRAGGVRSENAIKVTYPVGSDEVVARAFARVIQEIKPKSFWNKKLFSLPLFLLLLSGRVEAQQFIYGRAWDSVNLAPVDAGDSTNRAFRVNVVAGAAGGGIAQLQARSAGNVWTDIGYSGGNLNVPVNCVVGCSGSSFADSSAFSFGSTAVGLSAFVVDDVATNTVAENSAGLARMNGNRILYTDLSKSVANTNAFLVTGTGGTFPISGSISNTSFSSTQGTSPWIVAGGGTAGVPGTAVLTVQGIGSGTVIPVSGTFWQTTQPVSWTSQTVTATQATGSNLHAVIDTGSTTAVTQATGTNLHAVIDTGSTTAVTQATAANLNATVVQATPANLQVTATPITLTKGTQGATGFSVQELKDAGRTSRMFTANVASTATAETLITLTFSNNLATTSTCSSCAITSGKKIRIQSIVACARISTGTNAHTVTVNLRGAAGAATTATSPLQMTLVQTLAASSTSCNAFPLADIPDGIEYDANSGTNTFGITITDPGWVTAAQIVTFVISMMAFEY